MYIQAPFPNQKEQFVIEFHKRPITSDLSARTPQVAIGVWELKSKDRAGSSECMYNLNTGCDNATLTLSPVSLKGVISFHAHSVCA